MILLAALLGFTSLAVVWAMVARRQPEARQAPAAAPLPEWLPSGEDPWAELDRLSGSVIHQMPLRMAGRVRLVNDRNDKVIEEQPFLMEWRDTLESRYRIATMEVQQSARATVTVDHEDSSIRVDRPSPQGVQGMASRLWQWRQWLVAHKVALQVLKNDKGQYQLLAPGAAPGQSSDMRLYYDHASYRVSRAVWYDMEMGERTDRTADAAVRDTAASPYYINRVEFWYDTIRTEPALPPLMDYDHYLHHGYHLVNPR